ncbi:TNT domain-containing protein [Actinacidiphila glaucinigra]|uniref:TNT domain-containing protein n=1 Tax=Actinacidiphila glaucinigra TaxID=235986 RepID=A0A238ZKM1_9ACTN|nr:TNT domain-containing protein [Actinacidiphila glaucinigra]SNR83996.1 Protein of unknown function [Actinacidiphila glaucinigra]
MKRRQRISLSTLPALLVLLVGTLLGTVTSAHAEDWGPGAQLAAPPGRPAAGHGPGPGAAGHGPGREADTPGRVPGGPENPRICIGATFTDPKFFCGDPRLGPRQLPAKGLLGAMLTDYRRLDGQNANGFLRTWFDFAANSYKFPPDDGFLPGGPVAVINLAVGQRIDRFGGEGGRFLAPAGSPYAQRSIAPSNLNTFDPGYPFNYHLYKVVRSFAVSAGPVAPFYGQPGNGLQYVLPLGDSVANHITNGDLIRLN